MSPMNQPLPIRPATQSTDKPRSRQTSPEEPGHLCYVTKRSEALVVTYGKGIGYPINAILQWNPKTETALGVTWNEANYPDNLIYEENFGTNNMGRLKTTETCFHRFTVSQYSKIPQIDKPPGSNGIGLLIEGNGCFVTPSLRLYTGSFFLLKMKTITPTRAILQVKQEALPNSNFTMTYDSGCWFYVQGALGEATARLVFTFLFSTAENKTNPYSFVVDSLRVEGPTMVTKPGPPRRVGWSMVNISLRALAAPIVFPFVVILGICTPICFGLYYM